MQKRIELIQHSTSSTKDEEQKSSDSTPQSSFKPRKATAGDHTAKRLAQELFEIATADCAQAVRFFDVRPFELPSETAVINLPKKEEDEKDYPEKLTLAPEILIAPEPETFTFSAMQQAEDNKEPIIAKQEGKQEDEDRPLRRPTRRQHSLRLNAFSGKKSKLKGEEEAS